MASFFRRKKSFFDFSGLYTDMHSHLVPGIDDGAPDLETAISLIKGMIGIGYRKIITTPHVMWDLYKNTNAVIQAGWETVKNEIDRLELAVDFYAAAEYFIDDHFDEMIERDEHLLTLKENLLLVEFSFVQEPIELKKILFKLQIKGYQPVIAHPERYLYFGANKTWYDEMKNAGSLFATNLLSLSGYYGKQPQELAEWLAKKKYIDLLGADLHHARHLEALENYPITDIFKRLLDSGQIQNYNL